MAFNFNWSPLIADTSRARDMLTSALNKSPKPPIIVDDILVTELNLGSVPPELEILEVGDLAEDRFRGIFKMSYTGDAFLTLKTRVQANPLNTYLSMKPTFASPQPLAAASGLTIPLQITLSDIKLSGFVILVFSRQKGLTLVFRNDPLESLKVSSTFDSIPFVRDYLQNEIEGQLRLLFMEDIPAIIHQLSLRLWVPDYRDPEEEGTDQNSDRVRENTTTVDFVSSPSQEPTAFFGSPLDGNQNLSFSLESPTETHATFSQRNLLQLATLAQSQRTLSLLTSPIRDAVFRAWANGTDRGEHFSTNRGQFSLASHIRAQSSLHSPSSASTFSDLSDSASSSRPPLSTFSSQSSLSFGHGRSRAHPSKKRKHRIVNLRRNKSETDVTMAPSGESDVDVFSAPVSEGAPTEPSIPEEREDELQTPPHSPNAAKVRFHVKDSKPVDDNRLASPSRSPRPSSSTKKSQPPPVGPFTPLLDFYPASAPPNPLRSSRPNIPLMRSYSFEKLPLHFSSSSSRGRPYGHVSPPCVEPNYGGILEQAWMLKMATEIAKKVQEQKDSESSGDGTGFWGRYEGDGGFRDAPPAYAV